MVGKKGRFNSFKRGKEGVKMRILLPVAAAALIFVAGCGTVPAKYQAHLALGEAHLNAARYEKASKEFAKALEIGRKTGKVLVPGVMLGETCIRQGELGEAEKIGREVVERSPKQPAGWELLGKAALKSGRYAEAQDHFVKALGLAKKRNEKKRLGSLVSLTKALRAYAVADVETARRYFDEIKDETIAAEVRSKAPAALKMSFGS